MLCQLYMLTKEIWEAVIANLSRPDSAYKILVTSPKVLMSSTGGNFVPVGK